MFMAMDGNDSLKCVLAKEKGGVDENGVPKRGSSEHPDPRTADAGGTYFLTWEKVDKWSKELLAELVKCLVCFFFFVGLKSLVDPLLEGNR
jgi:hypothetical protein